MLVTFYIYSYVFCIIVFTLQIFEGELPQALKAINGTRKERAPFAHQATFADLKQAVETLTG